MAKPDWGVLQHQFLAEHAITRHLYEVDYG